YKNLKDGAIVWDDHATKCGVCLEIAATSIQDYKAGKSIKEIRKKIDEAYKNGYAEPTPTPNL
ncbi:PCYCGC motif-containing (lipo)protein, partial [Salmonella enterica]